MPVTRRKFLKIAAGLFGVAAAGGITLFDYTRRLPMFKKRSNSVRSFCPFCSMNCSVKIYYDKSKILSVMPENRSFESNGRVCPKAHLLRDMFENSSNTHYPVVRNAGSGNFIKMEYNAVLDQCAELINETREKTFITEQSGLTFNSFTGVAVIAGDNVGCEDAYVINKFSRIVGLSSVGTGALIRHNDAAKAFRSTFGISVQTNPVYDIKNSDVIFIIGANPVRSNPMQLKAVNDARNRGAKVIVVDPVAGETASVADIYLPVTPGADLVLLCGLIRYLLHNNRLDIDYLRDNTDAPFLVNESFTVNEKGQFSGYGGDKGYDTLTWSYIIDERGNPRTDNSMKRDNCVFQILQNHYSAYTPDSVLYRTGINADLFLKVAETLASTALPAKSCSFIYGDGFIQSAGGQGLRAVSILQLLCGNTGIAGGGIYGINDHSNQQGVSDQIGNWNFLPGYLPLPDSSKMENDYDSYLKNNSKKSNDFSVINYWNSFKGYFESQMRCWFPSISGEAAFLMLPRGTSNYSLYSLLNEIENGAVNGLMIFDEDLFKAPVSEETIKMTLQKLSWIIMFVSEQNSLSRYIGSGAFSLNTTVIIIPLPSHVSSVMHFVSADRRFNSYNGDSDFKLAVNKYPQIAFALQGISKKIADIHKSRGGIFSDPIINSQWKYTTMKSIADELGGFFINRKTADQNSEEFGSDDYFCGNWLYSGICGDKKLLKLDNYSENKLLRKTDRCWPKGEQILFNRAGVHFKDGTARHEKCAVFEDIKEIREEDLARKRPFLFNRDGVAYMFAREMQTGPLPLAQLNIELNESYYMLFTSGWRESYLATEYKYYNEYYPEDCLLMNRQLADEAGLQNGWRVVVESMTSLSLTVPLYVTDRITNKKCVNGVGASFKVLLGKDDKKMISPIKVKIYREILNGR
jgi:formate dehydrogenase major subunit